MNNTITGSIESIDQLIDFIDSLTDADYQYRAQPWFDNAIGQHLRHVVDLYQALINQHTNTVVDYDVRRRGASVEKCRTTGLKELNEIRLWLQNLPAERIEQSVTISTEVAITSQQIEVFQSSFGRELCFASSHLTHHLAMMVIIAKLAGKAVESALGLAPATASFLRK